MAERTCRVDGCGRKHLARGYCSTHYSRWSKTGDPGTSEVLAKIRRQSTVCAVDGCERPRKQRDWCSAHYTRWLKHGDLGPAEIRDWSIPRFCSVEGCGKPHDGHGLCVAHGHRMRRYGSPTGTPDRPPQGDPRRWRLDEVSYMGAHNRVRRLRGSADEHACTRCGTIAHDWAYDHLDPDERFDQVKGYAVAYSMNPAHYMPLCRSCHVLFDKRQHR